jgi:hypothetical protein
MNKKNLDSQLKNILNYLNLLFNLANRYIPHFQAPEVRTALTDCVLAELLTALSYETI